jgi:hypothetical protein
MHKLIRLASGSVVEANCYTSYNREQHFPKTWYKSASHPLAALKWSQGDILISAPKLRNMGYRKGGYGDTIFFRVPAPFEYVAFDLSVPYVFLNVFLSINHLANELNSHLERRICLTSRSEHTVEDRPTIPAERSTAICKAQPGGAHCRLAFPFKYVVVRKADRNGSSRFPLVKCPGNAGSGSGVAVMVVGQSLDRYAVINGFSVQGKGRNRQQTISGYPYAIGASRLAREQVFANAVGCKIYLFIVLYISRLRSCCPWHCMEPCAGAGGSG